MILPVKFDRDVADNAKTSTLAACWLPGFSSMLPADPSPARPGPSVRLAGYGL
jgi:hypothetical protein